MNDIQEGDLCVIDTENLDPRELALLNKDTILQEVTKDPFIVTSLKGRHIYGKFKNKQVIFERRQIKKYSKKEDRPIVLGVM